MLKKIISSKPKGESLQEARFTLGYVYLSLNRPREALGEFMKIVNARGFHKRAPDATFIAAEIYEKKFGNGEEAGRLYEKYLRLWPHGRLARRASGKLLNR